jgi:hypothetical protein
MNIQRGFALVPALLLGLSITAFTADPPAAATAGQSVADGSASKTEIPKSEQWFVACTGSHEDPVAMLHMAIKPSGNADMPVQVLCELTEIRRSENEPLRTQVVEGLCRNDEWLSLATAKMGTKGADNIFTVVVTRPNPKSTAGKLVRTNSRGLSKEFDLKEHTVFDAFVFFIVLRQPFDKEKPLEFVSINESFTGADNDCKLSYEGKSELQIEGGKRRLHKFVQTESGRPIAEYWLTDTHELVRVTGQDGFAKPVTEAEAMKAAAEVVKIAEPVLDEKMSECVAGCGTIRTALRAYFAQHNAYPTLDGVAGDQLQATLQLAPSDLDGKYSKAGSYLVNSTPKGYTIKATLGAQTYVIDDKGVESGTVRTTQ